MIFEVEQWISGGGTEWQLSESKLFKDLMAYLFVLALLAFLFYYLRSKRLDALHRAELLKQTEAARTAERAAHQEEPEGELGELREGEFAEGGEMKLEGEEERNQPVIT